MAQVYPLDISSCVERGSLVNKPIDSVLTSQVNGLPNTRNLHEMEMYETNWRIQMSVVELNKLLDWYHNVLVRVLSFDFIDPTSGLSREYFFKTPPSHSHLGGDQFIVSFNLETVS